MHNRDAVEGGHVTGTEQGSEVSQIIMHPEWNVKLHTNDIALMKLRTPMKLSDFIHPVCLPKQNQAPAVGSTCFITGALTLINQKRCICVFSNSHYMWTRKQNLSP